MTYLAGPVNQSGSRFPGSGQERAQQALSCISGIVGCALTSSIFTIPCTYSIELMYYELLVGTLD